MNMGYGLPGLVEGVVFLCVDLDYLAFLGFEFVLYLPEFSFSFGLDKLFLSLRRQIVAKSHPNRIPNSNSKPNPYNGSRTGSRSNPSNNDSQSIDNTVQTTIDCRFYILACMDVGLLVVGFFNYRDVIDVFETLA